MFGDRVYNHKTIEELKFTIELITYEDTKIIEFSTQNTAIEKSC